MSYVVLSGLYEEGRGDIAFPAVVVGSGCLLAWSTWTRGCVGHVGKGCRSPIQVRYLPITCDLGMAA